MLWYKKEFKMDQKHCFMALVSRSSLLKTQDTQM